MTHSSPRVHAMRGGSAAPAWRAPTLPELDAVLDHYPGTGGATQVRWISPRPLGVSLLVHSAATGVLFVKRHHPAVRSIGDLEVEHRFMAHVRAAGVPVPPVLTTPGGESVITLNGFHYEVHGLAAGADAYREAQSWTPFATTGHAHTAGAALATLHQAAAGFAAPARATPLLMVTDRLVQVADPVAAIARRAADEPLLGAELARRPWREDLAGVLPRRHAAAAVLGGDLPRLWAHHDWHPSNLLWEFGAIGSAAQVSAVIDFGLANASSDLFDVATALERTVVRWLDLDRHGRGARGDPGQTRALLAGYTSHRPLSDSDLATIAALLPIVHVDYALSELAYFAGITANAQDADAAYDYLVGHLHWFDTDEGAALLAAIRGENETSGYR